LPSHNMPAVAHSKLVLLLAAAVAVTVLPSGAHGLAPGKHLPRPEDVPYIKCQAGAASWESELNLPLVCAALVMRSRLRQRRSRHPPPPPPGGSMLPAHSCPSLWLYLLLR
jgi:hypothetical protein